jgi:hypothetical protein
VAESDKNPLKSIEALKLNHSHYELAGFDFLVAITIWYEILSAVNLVSKQLQSKDMRIDTAIDSVQGLIPFPKSTEKLAFPKHWKLQKKLQWRWIFIHSFTPSVKLKEKDSLMRA